MSKITDCYNENKTNHFLSCSKINALLDFIINLYSTKYTKLPHIDYQKHLIKSVCLQNYKFSFIRKKNQIRKNVLELLESNNIVSN